MEDNALIKIADFGLSQKVTSDNNCLCGEVGTKGYQAPEVITKNSKYGTKADMFSIGVIAYTLLRGSTPFCSREHPKCRIYGAYCIEDRVVCDHRVLNQEYKMEEEPYWHHVSFEAKDMVRSLLVMDPNQRLSAKEALAHKWMSSDKDAELEAINLSYNFMAFETYNRGRRNLRKFAHAAQAVIKMRKSISNATTQTSATGIESNGSSSIGFMGGSTCTDNTRANGDRDEMCRVCDSFDFEVNHFSRDEGEKDERDRAASTVFYDGTNRSSENEFIFPFDP
jgi:serine/threonine protein kinase